MALDAATLALVADELKSTLLDAKIDKIFEPTRDEVLITLRTRTDTHRLLLSARSGSARVCLTKESFENPLTPPGFCMLLRKHLTGGRLIDLRREPGDRIVFFDFRCTNEMGDLVVNTLAAELMGRYSNLVLIQDGRIIDALKRVDFEDSEIRQLLPGLAYTLPPKPNKPDFLTVSAASIVADACGKDLPVAQALGKAVGGVGPVVLREACWQAFGGETPLAACDLTEEQRRALVAALDDLRARHAAGGAPTAVRLPQADGTLKPTEFSFFAPQQYGPAAVLTEYPTYSEMLEDYYATKDRAERLRQKSRELYKAVHNLYDRAVRKQAARREELAQSEKADSLRLYGELLQANLWAIQKGDRQVTVENYYTGEPVTIRLDPRLSPNENAQKYFKDYKKKQTAHAMLQKLLVEGEAEIEYLATVLYEVNAAPGEQALNEIRAELKSQGYLKYYKQPTGSRSSSAATTSRTISSRCTPPAAKTSGSMSRKPPAATPSCSATARISPTRPNRKPPSSRCCTPARTAGPRSPSIRPRSKTSGKPTARNPAWFSTKSTPPSTSPPAPALKRCCGRKSKNLFPTCKTLCPPG